MTALGTVVVVWAASQAKAGPRNEEDDGDGSGVGGMRPAGSVQRIEAGTAGHCFEHRLHKLGKHFMKSLDAECTTSLGVVAHAVHNIDLGIGLRDTILRP